MHMHMHIYTHTVRTNIFNNLVLIINCVFSWIYSYIERRPNKFYLHLCTHITHCKPSYFPSNI